MTKKDNLWRLLVPRPVKPTSVQFIALYDDDEGEREEWEHPWPKENPCIKTEWELWARNLCNLREGALGDPEDPETMLRYWKAQEAANYPYASENVKFFEAALERRRVLKIPKREARWKGVGMGDYYCSLCLYTMSGRTKFCPECGAKMDEWEEEEG